MQFPLTAAALGAVAIGWLLFSLYGKLVGARMDQAFRDAGPESHKLKGRVPTGAGIVFVLAAAGIAIWAWLAIPDRTIAAVFGAAALMGLLGFVDDRAKVLGGSAGLKARFKLPLMLLCGALLLFVIRDQWQHGPQHGYFQESWLYLLPLQVFYLLGLFVWLGAINGSNFTDGLDGLLGTSCLVVLLFFLLIFGKTSSGVPTAIFIGALLAFLAFNWKPARLYMGDSGSLCLGAIAAGLFLSTSLWFYLGLCAFVWVVEVLSVMLQVAYFRRTGGRRIFLMTPIHHHFELAGWKETTVVYAFAGLQAWGCLSAWLWLRLGLPAGLASTVLLAGTFVFLVLRYRRRVA